MSDSEERVGLDTDELPLAKDAVQYMADKRILQRLEKQARAAGRMVRDPHLPTWAGELPHHLEPRDWRTGFLAVHEVDLPHEVHGNLKENAPQALLRDLFRPEMDTNIYHPWETLVELDRAGTRALRDALDAQKLQPVPHVEPLVREMLANAEAWRKIVRERWKPFLDDSQPRKEVIVFRDPSLNW